MKTIGIILALIAMNVTALAAEPFYFQRGGQWWAMPMPDDHWFSNEPLAPIIISQLPRKDIINICRELNEDTACAILTLNVSCHIAIYEGLGPREYAATLYHETAHCHGWPEDHPVD